MKWKFVNPVIIAFLVVIVGVFLLLTVLLVIGYKGQEMSVIAEAYKGVFQLLFHPASLPRMGDGFGVSTIIPVVACFWIFGFLGSAQPHFMRLRTPCTVIGVLSTLVWLAYSIILFFLSGVH